MVHQLLRKPRERYRRGPFTASVLVVRAAADTSQLRWPYPPTIDYEEAFLTENPFLETVTHNCTVRSNTSVSAQWVRTAYHDMSTANVDTGTGGMDASIRYELDRPENIGIGMKATLSDFNFAQRPSCSMADLLAIGVVFGFRACGGPLVPYRAGRVDATEAGVAGVPEPHQPIEQHIETFRKQGFTQSEMISLVACGHTLGGVRSADFPTAQIDSNVDVALFHGKQPYGLDVVTGYLDGSSPNPLILSSNVTMNSDQRIFSSDGNVTMQKLSDKTTFDQTCTTLLERMINTVPQGITLSDVILPIENRLSRVYLYPSPTAENELVLTAALRVCNITSLFRLELTSLQLLNPPSGLTVKLFWSDRRSPTTCPPSGCSVSALRSFSVGQGQGLKTLWNISTAVRYQFEAHIAANSSIDKFWFVLSDGSTLDNGGNGFVIDQDDFLWDPSRSKRVGNRANVTVAVSEIIRILAKCR
ncbi:heme peroxidase [Flagelloscypha sp. PMI_526]|nr:heme peroxidase [Flagelloscypha sp. PMI_526]